MQVQLIDPVSRQFNIESRNPEVILLWLGEYIPQMMTPGWRIRIWLATESEARLFGEPYMKEWEWTEADLLKLEQWFKNVRVKAYPPKGKRTNATRKTQEKGSDKEVTGKSESGRTTQDTPPV